MEFSPFNHIVKLCLQGMALEEQGEPEKAKTIFLQSWNEATTDFERFLASYYIARHQPSLPDTLQWLDKCLQLALKINDAAVKAALPSLYEKIASCYIEMNQPEKAKDYSKMAIVHRDHPVDKGPFYHGTKADLKTGDLLTAGGNSNYQTDLKMNHIYFTALVNGAGLAAALAKGDGPEKVYLVEPTGPFENDPNLTDKKFPGNPTRSYRSAFPLKITGEITDWVRQRPEDLQKYRDKLANNKGGIIN